MTLAIQALRLSPAYELIFQALEQRILAGVLKPGDRLPVESDLAASFGVNRSTVREGIRLLEREGLLRRVNGKRLEVSLPRYQDLAPKIVRQDSGDDVWVFDGQVIPNIGLNAVAGRPPARGPA